jgi:hypothetical protein
LFIKANTNVRTLIPVSQGFVRDRKSGDEPGEDTARDKDTEHRGNTRMVFWRLVRIEQEWPDDVADRTTGVAQRDSERFLRMPWGRTQYWFGGS